LCTRQLIELSVSAFDGTCTWQNGSKDSFMDIHSAGKYFVMVKNACGHASDTINVTYQECPFYIYIPNAFTPDNDFLNDNFKPVMSYQPTSYIFCVYNRWGEKIFSTTDYREGWNGTFQNAKAIEGAYIYTVSGFRWLDAKNVYRSGIFYLIRH
jgi:gliding motility-associated-like protein